MIKAAGHSNGQPMLILGLSAGNLLRLMEDGPIMVETAELGLPAMRVVIVAGPTENDILDELMEAGLIGPGTRKEDKRKK